MHFIYTYFTKEGSKMTWYKNIKIGLYVLNEILTTWCKKLWATKRSTFLVSILIISPGTLKYAL